MCGIAGFYQNQFDYLKERTRYRSILEQMYFVQKHRGPDESGTFLASHFGLAHVRLSIIDPCGGHQPMLRTVNGHTFGIVYNGELYNSHELKQDLLQLGYAFETCCDTEIILNGYLEYGTDFVTRMNGIFAFAILDPVQDCLFLFRDRMGVKPLFYTVLKDQIVFSSEIKGLFAFPGITPRLGKRGLNEIFSLGPARTPGCGVFENIHEVLPGTYLCCRGTDLHTIRYWQLESRPHTDSEEETVEKTAFLVQDAIRRQIISDVPICTFLSGGVDSSLVSAVCAAELKKKNRQLATFSFDFKDNDKYFTANAFQPSRDRPYVDIMVKYLQSDQHNLECDSPSQAELLYASVKAHDLPNMADVDSSMLYFCSLVSRTHKVALTGECADEIFGGYPWFHKKECFEAHTFPWTMDLSARKVLLSDDFIEFLDMDSYVRNAYEQSVSETPRCAEDTPKEARRREISWLNLKWFMQTLLNRMDRTSMHSGLEARVPFADHRIVEYLWNVPWNIKAKNGIAKYLLRQSANGLLPDEILWRRKSPYPKTYDTAYEALLVNQMREILADSHAPVLSFLDRKKVEAFLESPSDYGKPWYGQLMAAPQLLAYMIQINYWMEQYQIALCQHLVYHP